MLSKIKWNRLNTYYKKQNIQLNVQTKNIFIKKQGLKTFSILLHNDFKKDRIVHQQQQQQPLSTITRVPLLRNLIAYPNKHQIDHRRNPLYQQHIRSFSGLTRQHRVSFELANVIGTNTSSRGQITKGIWAYIKQNDLQQPHDRRLIRCDYKLQQVFDGNTEIHMLSIGKLVQRHILEPVE